jgi:hypothetical protein
MWLFFRPSLVFTSHISWHLYWHIFWNIFSHILYILTNSLRWTFAYIYIYNVLTHIHWHYKYKHMYINVQMLIHSVCICVYIYIYYVLIVLASDISYYLWHIFWHFFWHMSSDSFSDTSTGLAPQTGHHTCHMDEVGDMEPWGAMIRMAETKSGDRHISSRLTCRKKSPFWPWPGETIPWSSHPSDDRGLKPRRMRAASRPTASSIRATAFGANGHRGVHHRWGAQPLNQRFLNVKWLILPTLVVIIHN